MNSNRIVSMNAFECVKKKLKGIYNNHSSTSYTEMAQQYTFVVEKQEVECTETKVEIIRVIEASSPLLRHLLRDQLYHMNYEYVEGQSTRHMTRWMSSSMRLFKI